MAKGSYTVQFEIEYEFNEKEITKEEAIDIIDHFCTFKITLYDYSDNVTLLSSQRIPIGD